MATLVSDGIDIYYEVYGTSGPVLLLSHGFSATSEMWRGQVEALSRSHRLVLWDMRGHGRSGYPEDPAAYSEAATVADMAALLDTLHADDAIVGGLSLGGYMSLAFHYAHPRRVRALLIIDTGPGYKSASARDGWNATAEQTARDLETKGLAHLEQQSSERRTSTHRSADGLVRAARGMLAQFDDRIIRSLPDVHVPALVLVGENDTPFLNASDYMAAKIPHARKVVIPGAGHAANLDQPEAFNAAVLDFLDGL